MGIWTEDMSFFEMHFNDHSSNHKGHSVQSALPRPKSHYKFLKYFPDNYPGFQDFGGAFPRPFGRDLDAPSKP